MTRHTRPPLAPAALMLLALAVSAPAEADRFQTFSGDTTGAPLYRRPIGEGPSVVPFEDRVPFRAQTFGVTPGAKCEIKSVQDYDGYIHLYVDFFDPNVPQFNLVTGDDDAAMGSGSSRIPADPSVASITLNSDVYVLVTSGFNPDSAGSFQNLIHCDGNVQPLHGDCSRFLDAPADHQVCLHDRFAVKIDQVSNHASDGIATPVRFGSTDSAFFWFFNPKNFEVLIKVLNGCSINQHWWVFFAGTTNQSHRVNLFDNRTAAVRSYNRSLGPPAPAETDTQAFDCP